MARVTTSRCSAGDARLEQVGGVDHDPKPWAPHLVDQPPRRLGRGDDVGEFGFDAEIDAVGLGRCATAAAMLATRSRHASGVALSGCARHMSSGSRDPVHTVTSRVPIAGAAAIRTASRRKSVGAHRRVRVDHVEGAGHARRSRRRMPSMPHGSPSSRASGITSGSGSSPEQARLYCVDAEAGIRHRGQHRVGIGAGKGLGENPELHHTAPVASARLTARPSRTDCAMATMARTEATPSSAVAPRAGAPVNAASAKPSTWRR